VAGIVTSLRKDAGQGVFGAYSRSVTGQITRTYWAPGRGPESSLRNSRGALLKLHPAATKERLEIWRSCAGFAQLAGRASCPPAACSRAVPDHRRSGTAASSIGDDLRAATLQHSHTELVVPKSMQRLRPWTPKSKTQLPALQAFFFYWPRERARAPALQTGEGRGIRRRLGD